MGVESRHADGGAGSGLVLVEGEAGVGKTTLVRECLHAPALAGLRVRYACCPFPLGAMVEALRGRRIGDLVLSPLAAAVPGVVGRAAARMTQVKVALAPLAEDETAALITSLLGDGDVPADFVSFLHQRTEGVPLALVESVTLLRDRGDLVRRGDSWSWRLLDEPQVPPTVRDSVLERVERLDPVARRPPSRSRSGGDYTGRWPRLCGSSNPRRWRG